ncbi:MAG: hypothetical protein U1F60_15435 [Planctomycetota bacterium]
MNESSIAPWFLAAVLLGGPSVVAAQTPAPGARQGKLTDAATTNPLRVHGDARQFEAEIKDGFVHCTLKMAKPLVEGMFTSCELLIDCDDNPKTGEGGIEMRVRGLVGSRFQPNAAAPTNGTMKPIEHVRVSQSNRLKNVRGQWYWLNSDIEGTPPVIDGDTMRFSFVVARVREFGDRYKSSFSFRVRVYTSCSDQPIERLHSCADEGLPIVVDGKADEWSGRVVGDRGDELHPHLRCVDITGLRVDHSAERVFATVSLAESGLTAWRQDGDVQGMPVVTFYLEPMFPRYQEPVERQVRGGSASSGTATSPFHAAVGEKTIEVSFARKTGQGRYRVLVRSDVELEDYFEQSLRLDAEAK